MPPRDFDDSPESPEYLVARELRRAERLIGKDGSAHYADMLADVIQRTADADASQGVEPTQHWFHQLEAMHDFVAWLTHQLNQLEGN